MDGTRFGRLVIIGEAPRKSGRICVAVECDCGTKKEVQLRNLQHGITRSCGCLKREATAAAKARNSLRITAGGKTMTAAEWSAITGVAPNTIIARRRRGWEAEDAIFCPVVGTGRRMGDARR
jgi:hypothetical protein